MPAPLIVIVGPTAVGKTNISIKLAQELETEIISADSMQIYRYMDIGTAKPDCAERNGVPHHLIDIVNPDEEFTVADYQGAAEGIIEQLGSKGKIPLVVGGTGLYIKSLTEDFLFPDKGADWDLRRRLQQKADEEGKLSVYDELVKVDPETAARLHPNDLKRVIRAIEVYETTGEALSLHIKKQAESTLKYDMLEIGLTQEREVLYKRINKRVDKMVEAGLVDEVKALVAKGYHRTLNSMQGLGYKEIIDYLEGECTLEEAIDKIKMETRRYAKRQLTWFRANKRIVWFDVGKMDESQIILQIKELIAGKFRTI